MTSNVGIRLPEVPVPIVPFQRLALFGPMCSGKTYLANYIKEAFPHFKSLSFAAPLKEITKDLFGVQEKTAYSRELYQKVGTSLRQVDPLVWIYPVINKVALNPWDSFVLDDLRYLNEAEALRNAGFILIRVGCEEEIRLNRVNTLYPATTTESLNHISEKDFDKMQEDVTILSNGPIAKVRIWNYLNPLMPKAIL